MLAPCLERKGDADVVGEPAALAPGHAEAALHHEVADQRGHTLELVREWRKIVGLAAVVFQAEGEAVTHRTTRKALLSDNQVTDDAVAGKDFVEKLFSFGDSLALALRAQFGRRAGVVAKEIFHVHQLRKPHLFDVDEHFGEGALLTRRQRETPTAPAQEAVNAAVQNDETDKNSEDDLCSIHFEDLRKVGPTRLSKSE